jgi:hypothetical protein
VVVGVLGCPNLPLERITDADGAAGAAERAGAGGAGALFSATRGGGAFVGALAGAAPAAAGARGARVAAAPRGALRPRRVLASACDSAAAELIGAGLVR